MHGATIKIGVIVIKMVVLLQYVYLEQNIESLKIELINKSDDFA